MLVLSRKIDDEIIIDESITVRVLQVKGNTVRLGISAPRDVDILRGELPRREIEFCIEQEIVPAEPKSEIQFDRLPPQPASQSRLGEIAAKINGAAK